jgi:hypothetical protein
VKLSIVAFLAAGVVLMQGHAAAGILCLLIAVMFRLMESDT